MVLGGLLRNVSLTVVYIIVYIPLLKLHCEARHGALAFSRCPSNTLGHVGRQGTI